MSSAFLHSARRFGIAPAVLLLTIATGCASAGRVGVAVGYDCLVVENETADPIGVYLDVGTYVVDLGRVGPASRRALHFRRAEIPERSTHASLRIVPGPAGTEWPRQPGPLSEMIRTADTDWMLWRYTGRELIPNRAARMPESPAEVASDWRCSSTRSGAW